MSARRLTRLRRMTGAELCWRAKTQGRIAVERARTRVRPPRWDRHALVGMLDGTIAGDALRCAKAERWLDAHRCLSARICRAGQRFVIAPGQRTALARRIAGRFPNAPQEARAWGREICAGRHDLLGYRGLRFSRGGGAIDWHYDPVHDRRAPLAFWADVPFLDRAIGDHKITWEINRHQHWLALGRAYWLTDDARYANQALARHGWPPA